MVNGCVGNWISLLSCCRDTRPWVAETTGTYFSRSGSWKAKTKVPADPVPSEPDLSSVHE